MVLQPPRPDFEPFATQPPPNPARSCPERRQPDVFRLGRNYAAASTAQCEGEICFERELSRKVRVNRAALMGGGRAGDLSQRSGTLDRVEDAWAYFKRQVDTPTFARFAAAVADAPPRVDGGDPVGRRRCAQAVAAAADAAADVSALEAWEDAHLCGAQGSPA
jgi:hypothetical protein